MAVAAKPPKPAKPPRPAAPKPPTDPFALGLNLADSVGVHEAVLAGLPFSSFEQFLEASGLSRDRLAEAVGIALRTLDRRQHEKKLQSDESDRLFRLASLYRLAVGLFNGNLRDAAVWMEAPRPVLGGAKPLDLARTEVGARRVEVLIFQLEHGVYV